MVMVHTYLDSVSSLPIQWHSPHLKTVSKRLKDHQYKKKFLLKNLEANMESMVRTFFEGHTK